MTHTTAVSVIINVSPPSTRQSVVVRPAVMWTLCVFVCVVLVGSSPVLCGVGPQIVTAYSDDDSAPTVSRQIFL